jgi:tRNA(His) 5'-end guanylyltransferase
MSESDRTSIGDRMKSYEQPSTSRIAFKGQPLIARLDGKSFHQFTKGLKRPFDTGLSNLMRETMMALVDRFGAKVGYTQSDEITLAWYETADSSTDYPFSGRFQKLDSLLAAFATAFFNKHLATHLPQKADQLPTFDCRSFVVPSMQEAYHCFLWRQQDATKNAISMAAQSLFSHKQLQGLHGPQMQELMWKEKGVNFNDFPAFFKRGVFARRAKYSRMLTEAEMAFIPEQYRPTGPVERSFIDVLDIWLSKQEAPIAVLFGTGEIVHAPNPPIPEGTLNTLDGLLARFGNYDGPEVSVKI